MDNLISSFSDSACVSIECEVLKNKLPRRDQGNRDRSVNNRTQDVDDGGVHCLNQNGSDLVLSQVELRRQTLHRLRRDLDVVEELLGLWRNDGRVLGL